MENEIKIYWCSCQHPYQDQTRGKGNRVFIKKQNGTFYCSVCSKPHATVAVKK